MNSNKKISVVFGARPEAIKLAPVILALKEGIPDDRIFVTGKTVIDALFIALDKIKHAPPPIPGLPQHLYRKDSKEQLILITGHRRENFGEGFKNICQAISQLAARFPQIAFVYCRRQRKRDTFRIYQVFIYCKRICRRIKDTDLHCK